MEAEKPTTATGAGADALVERLSRAELAVPALPPPPLPLSADWAEYVLGETKSRSTSSSVLHDDDDDDDARSFLSLKLGEADTISSIALDKYDCPSTLSDLDFDAHDISGVQEVSSMSTPVVSVSASDEQDEQALNDILELIAASQMRMENQRAVLPSRLMPRRSSAPSAGALLAHQPLNEMVTRLRGRSSKCTQHKLASTTRSSSPTESQDGMSQQLDLLLSKLEAASGSRLEEQRARPPALSMRHARTRSQPELPGQSVRTDMSRLSSAGDPDTEHLLDCLERAGRKLDQQRAAPPTFIPTSFQAPFSAPASVPGAYVSSSGATSAMQGGTLVERLRGTGKRHEATHFLPRGTDDAVDTTTRNRLRNGSIHLAQAITFSLPRKRAGSAGHTSPSPTGGQRSKRSMGKFAFRLHQAGTRSTSTVSSPLTVPSAQLSGRDSQDQLPLESTASPFSASATVLPAAGDLPRSASSLGQGTTLALGSTPSPLTTPLPLDESISLASPLQIYTEWQVHLHTLVVLLWAKEGDAVPLSATACVTGGSSESFEVQVTFPATGSAPGGQEVVTIKPPAQTALHPGSAARVPVSFGGKGTAAEPLQAKIPCWPLPGHPVPKAHEGDSMGLAGLPNRLESCACKECDAQLILPREGGRRLLPLPSAGWEELVDAWMCHEDQLINRTVQRGKEVLYPDRDGVHATANTPHATTVFASEFWLVPKLADVSPGAVRWAPGSTGALLHCAACNAFLGRAEQKAEPPPGQEGEARCYFARPYITLSPPSATGVAGEDFNAFPARAAALLASTCDLGAERRVQLVDDGSSPAGTDAPETRIWLFQPLAFVAAQTNADGAVRVPPAVKVLFRAPPEAGTTEPAAMAEAVPLPLPARVRCDLLALLQERHARLPTPLAGALGWQAAWL